MTAQPNIRADVLGKLLLIQETLDVLPDSAGIAAFLRRALGEIPGVLDVHLCVGGVVFPPSREVGEVCAIWEAARSTSSGCIDCMVGSTRAICVPLRTARHLYGTLILSLGDRDAFSPYLAFVQNIANVVAATFETREYLRQLNEARAGLETQVAERTATLKESQEKFRALVETTSDWVWEVDASGTYTYASPKVEALLGFKPEEVVGKTPFDFMPPEEAQRVASTFLAASRAGKPFDQLLNINLHKDGHAVVLESSGTPMFDALGKLAGYRGIDRDVTERKRAEQEALEQFTLAETFFNHSVSCLVILDRDFNFLRVNEAYARACRKEIGEFAGRNHFEMYPSDTQPIFEDVVRCKRPFITFTRAFTFADQPERGTTYWDWTLVPILDEQGEVKYLVFSLNEVTERKRAEEALREREEFLNSVVENIPDMIFVKDAEALRFVRFNKASEQLLGYPREELLGKNDFDFFPKEEAEFFTAKDREVLDQNRLVDIPEESIKTRVQGERILHTKKIPIVDSEGKPKYLLGISEDITEKKQRECALHKVNRALKATSECNLALIHASDEHQLLDEICRIIAGTAGYRLAWVGYIEHDAQKTVRPVAQSGYEPGYMDHANITWADNERGRGPLGIAIRSGEIQVVQDVMTDPRFEPWRANAEKLGYGSVLVAPLLSDSKVIGALNINAEGTNAFDPEEIALLSELAADMAFGIVTLRTRKAHEQSAERLQRSMEATIQVVASTVESRDPYTAGHQRRVAELATAIARNLGLTEEQVHAVHLAGVVHDLGKIHVPAEILSKPGKLTSIEFQLIQGHPEAGYDILKDVDFPWPIAQIVYQHHERMDGSGYPRGLKADEILLEARIIAVADVVEAMASHRPYRPALGIEPALQEISANAGKYYDADVVRACIALFRGKAFAFKV